MKKMKLLNSQQLDETQICSVEWGGGGDETETIHKKYTLYNSLYLNEAGEKKKSL